MYVEVVANQSSVVFLRHTVLLKPDPTLTLAVTSTCPTDLNPKI